MSDDILKDLISLKLRIMDKMIDKLPEASRNAVKDMERSFLSALHEATREYSEEVKKVEESKGVVPISIE